MLGYTEYQSRGGGAVIVAAGHLKESLAQLEDNPESIESLITELTDAAYYHYERVRTNCETYWWNCINAIMVCVTGTTALDKYNYNVPIPQDQPVTPTTHDPPTTDQIIGSNPSTTDQILDTTKTGLIIAPVILFLTLALVILLTLRR